MTSKYSNGFPHPSEPNAFPTFLSQALYRLIKSNALRNETNKRRTKSLLGNAKYNRQVNLDLRNY